MPNQKINIIDVSDEDKKPKRTALQVNYAAIFSSQAGAEVLFDILGYAGVESINNATEAITMAKFEGRRAVGLFILHQIGSWRPIGVESELINND